MACQPDNIKWENLGVSGFQRSIRSWMISLAALIILVIAMYGIITFKQKTAELKERYDTDFVCPDMSIDFKQIAYNDYQSGQTGMMHCYCFDVMLKNYTKVIKVDFSEFHTEETTDKEP